MANVPLYLVPKLHTHTFPPLEGKPTDDDLLAIQRALLPLLMIIPYDQLGGVHSLVAILTDAAEATVAEW